MTQSWHLSEADIMQAIKNYAIEHGAKGELAVQLFLTPGDRPGERDTWTACVSSTSATQPK